MEKNTSKVKIRVRIKIPRTQEFVCIISPVENMERVGRILGRFSKKIKSHPCSCKFLSVNEYFTVNNEKLYSTSPTTLQSTATKESVGKFYKDANILITGGTGFLGKVIIEKLLRSFEVNNIYLLVRSKKGRSSEDRLQDIIQSPVFKNNRNADFPNKKQIHIINGDISLEKLGLSEKDEEFLWNNIDLVFHSAACVRYLEFPFVQ